MKKSIVTIVAFMLFVLAGFAQEKYEYAVVSFNGNNLIVETKEGCKKMEDFKVTFNTKDQYTVVVLQQVDKLQNEGWEVINTAAGTYSSIFYLRKRKQ